MLRKIGTWTGVITNPLSHPLPNSMAYAGGVPDTGTHYVAEDPNMPNTVIS